jgi:hypothetical protein
MQDQRPLIAVVLRDIEYSRRPVRTARQELLVRQEQRERVERMELRADVSERSAVQYAALEREKAQVVGSLVYPGEHEARNVQTRAVSSEQRPLTVRRAVPDSSSQCIERM